MDLEKAFSLKVFSGWRFGSVGCLASCFEPFNQAIAGNKTELFPVGVGPVLPFVTDSLHNFYGLNF